MPELYYKDAQKAASKEYRECVSKGVYPYLPVLEEFVSSERITMGTDMGLVQIPTEFIVGTRTPGRTHAFARNFMPLLEGGTEFANKWEMLCRAHTNEGIRDPIKVCEYMNRYYVVEGNKRVSVLKFFDAVTIPAYVTRVLPDRNEQTEGYFEYVEFNRISGVNFLELSRRGGYLQLQSLLGKEKGERWCEEERRRFANAYYTFRRVYEDMAGKEHIYSTGDAMLSYLKIYGFHSLLQVDTGTLKKNISKMWEEVELQQEHAPIELKTEPGPGEEPKKGILSKVRTVASSKPKQLHVAFLYDGTTASSGWTMGHELGRRYAQRVFEDRIVTTAYENVLQEDPQVVMDKAIADGNTVIFTTSPRLLPVSLRTAVEHPELVIMNCSLNTSHRYIRTYYARMYEVKFVAGAIAGVMTQDKQVGYIADYPIYGQIATVNAFALGVQMVNPEAKVYLEWSSVDGAENAYRRLEQRGIKVISSLDMAKMAELESNGLGLSMLMEDGERELLAIPVWNWGVYYEEMLRRILNKTVQTEYKNSRKALNYYWGLATGVLDLHCSELVPRSVRRLADVLKASIAQKAIHPFAGPIYLQDGTVIAADGSTLELEQIVNMDYLVDSVVGKIPAYTQLTEVGKSTVDLVGIPSATKTDDEEDAAGGSGGGM